jgi:2-oxoisovalerate dehydrogenase E2 component (dihydrolipoyl transacylase)
MPEVKQFKLPDVGEGLTEADIVAWHVKPGDSVSVNQIIVEIETAKAVVELPSPYEGVVTGLLAEVGQTVDVGTPIIAVDVGGEDGGDGGGAEGAPAEASAGGAASGDSAADAAARGTGADGLRYEALADDLVPRPPVEGAVEPGVGESPAPKVERQAVLVGYGVKLGATKRRQRKGAGARGRSDAGAAAGAGAAGAAAPKL